MALYTTPIPPRPIRSMTSYLPILAGMLGAIVEQSSICGKQKTVSQASPPEPGNQGARGEARSRMRVILLRKPNSRKLEALCLGRPMPFQAAGVNRTENLGIQNKD